MSYKNPFSFSEVSKLYDRNDTLTLVYRQDLSMLRDNIVLLSNSLPQDIELVYSMVLDIIQPIVSRYNLNRARLPVTSALFEASPTWELDYEPRVELLPYSGMIDSIINTLRMCFTNVLISVLDEYSRPNRPRYTVVSLDIVDTTDADAYGPRTISRLIDLISPTFEIVLQENRFG